MAFSDIKDLVQWAGGFSALLFVAFLAYVLIKTQSLHVLRWRIWQLVVGNQEPSDALTKAYIDEQSSLVAFRLFSKLPVRSLSEIAALQDWAHARNTSLHELSGIARFFNVAERCINLSYPVLYRRSNSLAIVVLVFLVVTGLFMGSAQSINLNVTATDHWYWVGSEQAQAGWWNGPFVPGDSAQTLMREDCANIASTPPEGFTAHDRKVLCDLWHADSQQAQNMLKHQRWGFFVLTVVFLVLLGWRILRNQQLDQLERLRSRIMTNPATAQ